MRNIFLTSLLIFALSTYVQAAKKESEKVIKDGSQVKFHYTLSIDGKQVETSKGDQPMEYTHGEGQIIKGLEKELKGMKEGNQKMVSVQPEEGYGEIDRRAFQPVPHNAFPENMQLQAGMMVNVQDKQGRTIPAIVQDIKEDQVLLNFNHPLAGQQLVFDVEIVSIK